MINRLRQGETGAQILLWLLVVCLIGCVPTAVRTSAPTASATLAPGKAAITGQVDLAGDVWSGTELSVFAAHYKDVNTKGGFYVLEPNRDPHAGMDAQGFFRLGDLEPGKYVLVVGPSAEEAAVVVDDQDKARVIEVPSGQTLEMGKLKLAAHN